MHTKNFLRWLLPSENRLMPSRDWTEVDAAVCRVLETALEEEDLRGRAQILQKDVSEASVYVVGRWGFYDCKRKFSECSPHLKTTNVGYPWLPRVCEQKRSKRHSVIQNICEKEAVVLQGVGLYLLPPCHYWLQFRNTFCLVTFSSFSSCFCHCDHWCLMFLCRCPGVEARHGSMECNWSWWIHPGGNSDVLPTDPFWRHELETRETFIPPRPTLWVLVTLVAFETRTPQTSVPSGEKGFLFGRKPSKRAEVLQIEALACLQASIAMSPRAVHLMHSKRLIDRLWT